MTTPVPPRGAVTRTARATLHGRLLLQLSSTDVARGFLDQLPVDASGAVITGRCDYGLLAQLRNAYPDLVLGTEPDVDKLTVATSDAPFVLGEADLFGEPTLDRCADDQRAAGASFAILPTGRIQVGDDASLKAAVRLANQLDRSDVVLRVPCEAAWTKANGVGQLAAVLKTSRHPVALSLAHDKDPMDGKGAVEGVRRLTTDVPDLMLWRADLSAIAHLAEGGLAAGVGLRPSQRHGLLPKAFAVNPGDRRPHVLVRTWLRFVRTSFLEDVYASATPPRCSCSICQGRTLDRFGGTDDDQAEAHAHNVEALMGLRQELGRLKTIADRQVWWCEQVRAALQAHADAAQALRRDLPPHSALAAWGRILGIQI